MLNLSFFSRLVINLLCFSLDQYPSGVLVHPSGVEIPLSDYISGLRSCYGDKQGKQFRVWVDRVLATQISSDTWLVKFHKWELSGESLSLSLSLYLSRANTQTFVSTLCSF